MFQPQSVEENTRLPVQDDVDVEYDTQTDAFAVSEILVDYC